MATIIAWLLLSFLLLYIGGNLVVQGVSVIANSLKVSKFFISFFVLGLFTSITEISVGVTALVENKPEIYVGNLLGSTVVIFLLIIPFLAIAGNSVKLSNTLSIRDVILTSFMITLPAIATLDGFFGIFDAIICIISYFYILLLISKKSNILERLLAKKITKSTLYKNTIKVLFATLLVLVGSYILVENITTLGKMLNLSPFVISIIIVSIGTNVPEITIAITSIIKKHKEVAIGNYLGSAALNTFEIGVLTLINKERVPTNGSNFSIVLLVIGLIIFSLFTKSKNDISRKEGLILITCYILFVILELFTGPNWTIK